MKQVRQLSGLAYNPHMLIAVTEPAVVSLSHVAIDCPASLSHLALRLSNALTIFHFLALGG